MHERQASIPAIESELAAEPVAAEMVSALEMGAAATAVAETVAEESLADTTVAVEEAQAADTISPSSEEESSG
jgi:hypothetical protein